MRSCLYWVTALGRLLKAPGLVPTVVLLLDLRAKISENSVCQNLVDEETDPSTERKAILYL